MQLEFNVTLDNTNCHIRAYKNHIVHSEMLYEHPHKHYSMEFHCIFGGEEVINLSKINKHIHLCEGDILLLPLGVYHGVYTDNTSVDRICFNFSAECGKTKNSPFVRMYQSIDRAMVFEDEEIRQLLRQCRQLQKSGNGLFTEAQQGLLLLSVVLRLFARISENGILRLPEEDHELRQRWIIEDHIEQHFTDSVGLEGLAKSLFLSQRQTRKLVQKFLGEDYKTVIVRRRMELAEIFLADPEKSLEEIAWQVGYRSYSGFQLCFKRYFGVTPSEKRKELLEK